MFIIHYHSWFCGKVKTDFDAYPTLDMATDSASSALRYAEEYEEGGKWDYLEAVITDDDAGTKVWRGVRVNENTPVDNAA